MITDPGNGLRTADGHTWSPSPVVMLCGTADDYTPVFQCDSCAARINEQGGRAEVIRYEYGLHSFDVSSQAMQRLIGPSVHKQTSNLPLLVISFSPFFPLFLRFQ